VNHVPDEALAAIDTFGEGLLLGEAHPVETRLRSDLRLSIPCTAATLAERATTVTVRLEHASPEAALREHGPFVGTVLDNVETRLREWGVDPPASYEFAGRADGWCRYEGRARW
jgi:hypothetical protein